jgi:hypothetical protein
MWRTIRILALALLPIAGSPGAEGGAIRYYVQLIRGTDSDQPPQAESKLVGSRLDGIFRGPLKWKSYWEVCRREVNITPGQKARLRLNSEREVEIDLSRPGKRIVRAFQKGELVDRTVGPVGEAMTLIGGKRDLGSVWFIVVRRDQPGA